MGRNGHLIYNRAANTAQWLHSSCWYVPPFRQHLRFWSHSGALSNSHNTIGSRIFNVDPAQGSGVGGDTVVISGEDLGDGSDIREVRMGGILATILSQTAQTVVVTTGRGGSGWVNVTVTSVSAGTTSIDNGFFFLDDGARLA
mgnify:CR=1 FL=1